MIMTFDEKEEKIFHQIMGVLTNWQMTEHISTEDYSSLSFVDIQILRKSRKVEIKGIEVRFSRFEFDVLLFLAKHPRQVFTKEQIFEAVWDDIPVSVEAKVECMIYSIRKKLRKYTDRQYIQTVWGVGYKFDPET